MLSKTNSMDSLSYWPAYLDALINVLIALLFVLSIFAMFSVISRDSVITLVRNTPYGFDVEMTQSPHAVGHASLEPSSRRAPASTLAQLTGLEQEPVRLHFSGSLAKHPVNVSEGRFLEQKKAVLLSEIEYGKMARQTLIDELTKLQKEALEKNLQEKMPQRDVYRELAIERPVTYDLKVDDLLAKQASDVVWEWVFAAGRSVPEKMDWPEEYLRSEADLWRLQLLVFVEPDNPRQQREAYFRLMAIRTELIKRGNDVTGLTVRVHPDPDARRVANPHATVFLVLPQGKQ